MYSYGRFYKKFRIKELQHEPATSRGLPNRQHHRAKDVLRNIHILDN